MRPGGLTSRQRTLVTGASGFVGRVVCKLLASKGCRVRALLRQPASGNWDEFIQAELGSADLSSEIMQDIDTVYHLAGIAHAIPGDDIDNSLYRTVNVEGSRKLAEVAVDAGVRRFVFVSSVKAAADPGERCVDESWQSEPADPYGLSKLKAEKALLGLSDDRGMQVVVLRPSLVYGPGVKGNLLRMLDAVDHRRFPPVPDTGNRRSMVHVEDLARAAWLAATVPELPGRIYIVSDGQDYSTRQLYEWMCLSFGRKPHQWSIPATVLQSAAVVGEILERLTGRQLPLDRQVLQRLLGSACYRAGKLEAELGWQPLWSFQRALPAMVDEYRNALARV